MKNSLVRLVLAFITLVFAAAFEELMPKTLGVGFPLLLSATLVFSTRSSAVFPILFALAAGGFEDSLSQLPFLTSVAFFVAVAVMARLLGNPSLVALVAYPIYQIWLFMWGDFVPGAVFGRLLVAAPIGFLSYLVMTVGLEALERKAAVDEAG